MIVIYQDGSREDECNEKCVDLSRMRFRTRLARSAAELLFMPDMRNASPCPIGILGALEIRWSTSISGNLFSSLGYISFQRVTLDYILAGFLDGM
jgi:hypothetical protein